MKKGLIVYLIIGIVAGLILGIIIGSSNSSSVSTSPEYQKQIDSKHQGCLDELDECNFVDYSWKEANYVIDINDLISNRIDEEWCINKIQEDFKVNPKKCDVQVFGNQYNDDDGIWELQNVKVFCDCLYKYGG